MLDTSIYHFLAPQCKLRAFFGHLFILRYINVEEKNQEALRYIEEFPRVKIAAVAREFGGPRGRLYVMRVIGASARVIAADTGHVCLIDIYIARTNPAIMMGHIEIVKAKVFHSW